MAESAAVIGLHGGVLSYIFKGTQGSTFGVPVTDLWKTSAVRDGHGVLGRISRDSRGQERWLPVAQHTEQRAGPSRTPASKPPRLNLGTSDEEVAEWRQRMQRADVERARRRRMRGEGVSSRTSGEDESAIVGADGESPKGTTRLTDSPATPRSPTKTGQQGSDGRKSSRGSQTQSSPRSTPSSTPPSPPPSPSQSSPRADVPNLFKDGWLVILLLCLLGLFHLPTLLYLLWLHVDMICRERFRDKRDVDLADVFLIIALLCIGVRCASHGAFSASQFLRVVYWCSLIWIFLYFVPEFSWTLGELYDCAFYRMGWQGWRQAVLPLSVLAIFWLARPYWPEICRASRRAPKKARDVKDAVALQISRAAGACTDVKVYSWAWVWQLIIGFASLVDLVYARFAWIPFIILIDRGLAALLRWGFRLGGLGEPPPKAPNTISGLFPRTLTTPTPMPSTPSTPEVRRWAEKYGLDGLVERVRYRRARSATKDEHSPITSEQPSPGRLNRQGPSNQADQLSTSSFNEPTGSEPSVRRSSASETAAVFRQLVSQRMAQRSLRGDSDSTADLQADGGSSGRGSPECKDGGSQKSHPSSGIKSPAWRSPGKSPLRQMWRPDDIVEGEDDGTISKTRSPSDPPHVSLSPSLTDVSSMSEDDARKHILFKVFRNSDGCKIESDGTFRSPSGHELGKIDQGLLLGCDIIAGGQLWSESPGPGSKIGQLNHNFVEEVSVETSKAALPHQSGGEQVQIRFAFEDSHRKQTYAIWLVNLPEAEEYHKELSTARGENQVANQALLDYFEGCTIDGDGNLVNTGGVVDGRLDLADPRDAVLAATRIGAGSSIIEQVSGSSVGIIVDMNAPNAELLNFEQGRPATFELVYHHFGPPARLRSVKFVMKPPRVDDSGLLDLLPDVLYTGKGFSIARDATNNVHQLALPDGSVWGSVRPSTSLFERDLPGCSVGEDGVMRDELSRVVGVARKIMISKRDHAKVERGDDVWCEFQYLIYVDSVLFRKREHERSIPFLIRKPTPAAAASSSTTSSAALSGSKHVVNLGPHIGNKIYGEARTAFAAARSIPRCLSSLLAEIRSLAPWLNAYAHPRDLDKGAMKNIEVMTGLWNTEVFLEKLVEYKARDQGLLPDEAFEEALAVMPGFVDLLTQIDDATANYPNRADIATHMTARALHIQDLLQELLKEGMDQTAAQFIYTGHDTRAAAQHETQRTHGRIMRSNPSSPRTMLGPKRRRLAGQAQGTAGTSPSGAQGSPMSIGTPRVRFVIDTEPGKTWWRAEPTPIIVTPPDIVYKQLPNLTPAQYLAREREMQELVEIRRHFDRLGNEANNLIRSLWSDYHRDDRDITAFETRRDALVDAFGLHVFQPLDRVYGEDDFVRQEKSGLQDDIYLYGGRFQQVLQRIRDEWDMCGTLIGLSYDDLAPPFPEIEKPKKPKVTRRGSSDEASTQPQGGKHFPTYDESVKTALKEIDGIWHQARTINEQEQKLWKRWDPRGREQLARLRQSQGKSHAYILRKLDKYLKNTASGGEQCTTIPVPKLVRERAQRMDERIRELFARSAPDPSTYTVSDLVGLKVDPDGFVYDSQRRPIAKLVQGDAEQVAELGISADGTLKDAEGQTKGTVELMTNPTPPNDQTIQQSSSGADDTDIAASGTGPASGGQSTDTPPDPNPTTDTPPNPNPADLTPPELNPTTPTRPAPTLDLFQIYTHQAHTSQLHRAHLAAETLHARAQRLWTALIAPHFTPTADPTENLRIFLASVHTELDAIASLVDTDVLQKADQVAQNPLVDATVRGQAEAWSGEMKAAFFAWWQGVCERLEGLKREVVAQQEAVREAADGDGEGGGGGRWSW
ncbi:hypothetical protein Tdes44962_MAKER08525 [Teratosphaeria destructans]|uniref:Uncharacterized protein n=1 Tax=Teratosphaeria destructans TaxID=418781 RepID=A0A9W7SVY2_9PEZI|nr:hypothetical protein Tdes44962_MAKER08525 [Teratosphaeria destructans]